MISNKSEYKYVTEEIKYPNTKDIVINGEIMPLRTGHIENQVDKNGHLIPKSHILRGEDIYFLKEGIEERRRAVSEVSGYANRDGYRKDFRYYSVDQKLTKEQLDAIDIGLHDIVYPKFNSYGLKPWEWINILPDESFYVEIDVANAPSTGEDWGRMSKWTQFGVNEVNPWGDYILGDNIPGLKNFTSTQSLNLDITDIENMFSDLGKFKYYVPESGSTSLSKDYTKELLGYNDEYRKDIVEKNIDSTLQTGSYLYYRECDFTNLKDLNDNVSMTFAGWSGECTSISNVDYGNNYAESCRIYVILKIYSSVMLIGPNYNMQGTRHDEIFTDKYVLCYLNDGFSIDLSKLLSLVNRIKTRPEFQFGMDYFINKYAPLGYGFNDYQASIFLLKIFPVYNLRGRTRWDL